MCNDSENISLEKAYEVRHWGRVLNLNENDLFAAVRSVGKGLVALQAFSALARCRPIDPNFVFTVPLASSSIHCVSRHH
jgi:hypothetical protein